VLLILAALRYRQRAPAGDRARIPIPVLTTAQDWDPRSESVTEWLARQMRLTYPRLPELRDAAVLGALMTGGRIALIIDGLDETEPDIQSIALQALSQQASCRTVILSRIGDMAIAAVRQGVLRGAAAIELQPVSPAEAASYLERVQIDPPPEAWHSLSRHLRDDPAGPLSKALDNPLALSLVRDTIKSEHDARELLALAATQRDVPAGRGAEVITDYLLDRVLPAAYARQPGQPPLPYDLATAHNALTKIAAQMNRQGTRDLHWSDIVTWAPRMRWIQGTIALWLAVGLAVGLMREGGDPPRKATKLHVLEALKWERSADAFIFGLPFGPFVGFLVGFFTGLLEGPKLGLAVGLATVPAVGLTFGLLEMIAIDPSALGPQSPATSWQFEWNFTLLTTLMVVPAAGLPLGLAAWLAAGPEKGFVAGLVASMAGPGFRFEETHAWPALLASAEMAVKWRTPARLMRFLEDAHSRNILRTVGPAYQFRHARLQDRLAAAASFHGDTMHPQASQQADRSPAAAQHESAATASPRRAGHPGSHDAVMCTV
jgi:hypothetical protein